MLACVDGQTSSGFIRHCAFDRTAGQALMQKNLQLLQSTLPSARRPAIFVGVRRFSLASNGMDPAVPACMQNWIDAFVVLVPQLIVWGD
jgi:hypothetical protein